MITMITMTMVICSEHALCFKFQQTIKTRSLTLLAHKQLDVANDRHLTIGR